MNIKTGCQREDKETRKEVSAILSCFNTHEAKIYWLNVLVKEEKISLARAGMILIEERI